MRLQDGYTDIPQGKIAAVVTHLQMSKPAPLRQETALKDVGLRIVTAPTASWYKAIFRHVGAEDWLWFSRLQLEDAVLEAIIQNPKVEVYALTSRGLDDGLLELDFRIDGSCELAFFGVSKNLIGSGAGRCLMNRAIERAWLHDIERFHVHTCTLDHPAALGFYIRSGFRPVRQQIEVANDPRVTGLLPDTSAPHVPIFR